MRNVANKIVEKIKPNLLCSIIFFFFENCVLYKNNVSKYGITRQKTGDHIIQRMRFEFRLIEAII